MKIPLQPCFILHQRNYRETSLILEVFSRQSGRVSLVARGANRRNSKNRPLMQLNQKLQLAWSIRGEMGTLTSIEAVDANYGLTGTRLFAAFYVNELLMRLLHKHEPHTELFDAYEVTLKKFRTGIMEDIVLRLFEKQLLESLGYGLVLDHDVTTGEPIKADQDYYYQVDYGPAVTPAAGRECIKISGATLLALGQNTIADQPHLHEAKLLNRRILKTYLGERPLESRRLFSAYIKNQSGVPG